MPDVPTRRGRDRGAEIATLRPTRQRNAVLAESSRCVVGIYNLPVASILNAQVDGEPRTLRRRLWRAIRWKSGVPRRYRTVASLAGGLVGGAIGFVLSGDALGLAALGGLVADSTVEAWWWRRTRVASMQRDAFGNPRMFG